jgi:hypothetical protein
MLEEITQLLAGIVVPGAFSTRRVGEASDLHLDVKGVGPIPLPVPESVACQLCGVARAARYGLRDQTLLDERVRAGWEIGKRQIRIDARRWQQTLQPQLEKIGRDLGLAEGCTLRAELYNLLVYGPGQFFAPHQDSEKADGMVGTLVVTLPSMFKGGALVVEHHDEKVSYRGSRDRLTFVAFYADCHHEVRPVTDGYRIVLTYNLFLEGATDARLPTTGRPVDALVHRVRAYFETPKPARGPYRISGISEGPPDRLVYLLDHQYTQKGLGWQGLKNGDAARAAVLREVAAQLDCEIALALADVHESWSCEDEYDGDRYGWRRRYRDYDEDEDDDYDEDEDDDDDDDEAYTLVELFDSSIELRHWIGPSGGRVKANLGEVSDDEVCYTKASVDLEPFASEHEGYTGNAGNTVDRWYHRAAVVLWPRSRTFVIRAKASPAWAIRELSRSLATGAVDKARAMVTQLRPFWNAVAEREQDREFVEQILGVAVALDDRTLAAALLEPIALERLTPRSAPRCAALLDHYGLSWCWALFERWARRDGREDRWAWLAALPKFCGPLCAGGAADPRELTRRLVRSQWASLDKEVRDHQKRLPSSEALDALLGMSKPIVGLLATAAIVEDRVIQETIVERVTSARGYPVRCAVQVLRTAHARSSSAELPALGLGALYDDCTRTMTRLVDAPVRTADDWSITTPLRCACALCKQLARFLVARGQRQLEWQLAKERRAHVHQIVERHELAVSHQTRRSGSPYTLVLAKTRELFAREATERKAWASDLAWLNKTAPSFAPSRPRSEQGGPSREAP